MLWTLLSIVVAFAELIAFMSADWLVGKAKSRSGAEPGEPSGPAEPYHPTLGIYARCIRNPGVQHVPRETLCGPYAESFGEIASGFWQATAIFLAVGIFVLCTVALVSVFTMCVQSIMKKSIFNVCGLLQGIAGKCLREGRGLAPSLGPLVSESRLSGQTHFASVFSAPERAAGHSPSCFTPVWWRAGCALCARSCSLLFPRRLG